LDDLYLPEYFLDAISGFSGDSCRAGFTVCCLFAYIWRRFNLAHAMPPTLATGPWRPTLPDDNANGIALEWLAQNAKDFGGT
jgi:hypothetical protein